MPQSFTARPGGTVRGSIRVPGDKSISHRSIMLGSIAQGTTEVSGFLEGADAICTMNIFRALGVRIDGPRDGRVTIQGVGLRGLRAPATDLDCGNSGTSMRLLSGLLAAQSFTSRMVGDSSLTRRPMRRVTEPLARMGARIDSDDGRPPLVVHPVPRLVGIDFQMPVASAQVKSALLLAGLYAEGRTSVTEPAPTRDHTERMLAAFGVEVSRDGATASVQGGQSLQATAIDVPADISSAAFFLVAGAIASQGELLLRHVGVNPTRTGIIEILRLMGADLTLEDPRMVGGEPVADLRIRASQLRGIEVPPELVPLAIDEFPVLFVAAACARGRTVVTGAEELRVKESDRVAVMAEGLARLGIDARPTPDGMVIEGRGGQDGPVFSGGEVDSHGDHRPAMAFAVASLRAAAPIHIRDTANVGTSFPGFVPLARQVGIQVDAAGDGSSAATAA
jgi:3-phosphoshikimate 1-carboxyvinyltransferase